MCKELTVISIFLLGLLADILWIGQKTELGFNLLLQSSLAVFLIILIMVAAKKFLSKYQNLRPKFSRASVWKFDRCDYSSCSRICQNTE